MKLFSSIQALAIAAMTLLGAAAPPAQAAITTFFSSGATCAGGAAGSFSPTVGSTTQISLCVTTTLPAERLCGHTTFLSSASAGEDGRFNITARAAGTAFTDLITTSPPLPLAVTNPNSGSVDFGALPTPYAPSAAPATILLHTFTLATTALATNPTYVISAGAGSVIAVDQDGGCGTISTIPTSVSTAGTAITLSLSAAPTTFSSANATTFTVNSGGTFNVQADGAPTPTYSITAGSLPTGVSLSAAGVLAGTPALGTVGAYPVTIRATNASGNVSQSFTLNVQKANQAITFANPGAQTFSATPIASGASSNAGLAVALTSSTTSVCTVSGLNIQMVAAGTCTINANQLGDANYNAATQVTQSFTINGTAPGAPTIGTATAGNAQGTITFTPPASTGGSPITGYTASCTPGPVTGTNTVSPIVVSGLTNGTAYTCTVTATNAVGPGPASAASNSFTPTPTPVAPTITSANSFSGFTLGTAGTTFTVTATGTPATFTYAVAPALPAGLSLNTTTGVISGTPTVAGAFTVTLTAINGTTPNGTQSFTLNIAKAAQTINFTGPGAQTYSTTPIALTATATSGLAVTFTSTTPAICSVTGSSVTMLGVGTCTIAANQGGNTNYNAATQVTQSFTISQAAQTITFGAQTSPRGFSATPISLSPVATASSGLPVTYTSTTPGVCSVSGANFTTITQGVCTIAANQAGNALYSAAAQVTQSVTINQGTQTINFPTQPSQQLGTPPFTIGATASSGLAVSFASTTPTVCTTTGTNGATVTLLILGTCTITASQAGNANFSAAANVVQSFSVVPPGAVMLSSPRNPAGYRESLLLTATVSGNNPTGTVSFSALGQTICASVPIVGGKATCPVPGAFNTASQVTYSVSYSGDSSNPASNATLQQFINMDGASLSVGVSPLAPVAGKPLSLKAMVTARNLGGKLTFFENGVALDGCAAQTVTPLPGATDIGVVNCTIATPAVGNHTYVATYLHPSDPGFEQVNVPVSVAAALTTEYTDMWWAGQAENGWGLSIAQHGMTQFVVIYAYDNAGKPVFYAMPGGTWNAGQTAYTGALYLPSSSPYNAYDTTKFNANASVGTATITYTGTGTATLAYTINGVSGTKTIQRQVFSAEDGQPKLQVNDMWWGGVDQNGWGMNIAQQGRMLFPVWYTYDADGKASWFVVPGGTWTGATFTGDIYSTKGSPWLGVAYNPAALVSTKVGTMSIAFSDQNNAIMTYTINGVTQSKQIVRQPY